MGETLREIDNPGEGEIPSEAYYCAQVARAICNSLSFGVSIAHLPQLIHA